MSAPTNPPTGICPCDGQHFGEVSGSDSVATSGPVRFEYAVTLRSAASPPAMPCGMRNTSEIARLTR